MRYPNRNTDPGLREGYRSGLEETIGKQLESRGLPVNFESVKIPYKVPSRISKYTPDFWLPNGIVIESKGRFVTKDRQKHMLVQAQHPDLDIRFVFSRSKTTISKASRTTYGMWCEKQGIPYADKLIPISWLTESPEPRRMAALKALLESQK